MGSLLDKIKGRGSRPKGRSSSRSKGRSKVRSRAAAARRGRR